MQPIFGVIFLSRGAMAPRPGPHHPDPRRLRGVCGGWAVRGAGGARDVNVGLQPLQWWSIVTRARALCIRSPNLELLWVIGTNCLFDLICGCCGNWNSLGNICQAAMPQCISGEETRCHCLVHLRTTYSCTTVCLWKNAAHESHQKCSFSENASNLAHGKPPIHRLLPHNTPHMFVFLFPWKGHS